MRVALAQINTTVGDLEGNTALVLGAILQAREARAELLVLPEMVLCGYPPMDLLEREDFLKDTLRALDRVAAAARGVHVLVGHIDANRSRTGRRLHNSLSLVHEGRRLSTVHKTLLPTYDVFDEARFFEPGAERGLMSICAHRVAVTVCEDLWSQHGLPERRPYALDPVKELLARSPDLIINASASPYHLGKPAERVRLFAEQVRHSGLPLVYCNQVGGNDGVIFDGNSVVMDASGQLLKQLSAFEPDFGAVDLDLEADNHRGGSEALPLVAPGQATGSPPEEEACLALRLGLRDYVAKAGFEKVVIGLSGGIDSALVAVIAADALGPEKVLGLSMPSAISSEHSLRDARNLASNLGIELRTLPISETVASYESMLAPFFEGLPRDVTEENIQARVRGSILMAVSNKLGHLVLCTGNKSELAMGYCTLYGDMCGGLAVLADLPKTLVYHIARWLNRDTERIPASTLTKPPSAELSPGQTDQDSLPDYGLLDAILQAYVEENLPLQEILDQGLPEETVRQVLGTVDRQEFKRRQAAPVLKLSPRAFGTGRVYPVVQRYDPFGEPG